MRSVGGLDLGGGGGLEEDYGGIGRGRMIIVKRVGDGGGGAVVEGCGIHGGRRSTVEKR